MKTSDFTRTLKAHEMAHYLDASFETSGAQIGLYFMPH